MAGMNHQPVAEWSFDKAPWRKRPSFCLNLHITYTDGTKEILASDESFKVKGGPITFNAIYVAENYDSGKNCRVGIRFLMMILPGKTQRKLFGRVQI